MLDKIIETKKQEVLALKKNYSSSPLAKAETAGQFYQALQKTNPAIIAEIKKGSPSKGIITEDFNVSEIANYYQNGGAAALSVLTDQQYFFGAPENIKLARQNSSLPILRKDFIIDPIQIIQSQHLQANAILLIVAALSLTQLTDLYQMAFELGIDVLVECHDQHEVEIALNLNPVILGINNRNLKTFKIDLMTSIKLKKLIPDNIEVITESGINHRNDILFMQENGISSFLIGESLMRQPDRTQALQDLII